MNVLIRIELFPLHGWIQLADTDPDPTSHQSNGNLRPLVYIWTWGPFWASIASVRIQLFSNADPDPGFQLIRIRILLLEIMEIRIHNPSISDVFVSLSVCFPWFLKGCRLICRVTGKVRVWASFGCCFTEYAMTADFTDLMYLSLRSPMFSLVSSRMTHKIQHFKDQAYYAYEATVDTNITYSGYKRC